MAQFDAASRHELSDALVYELFALSEYRPRLYADGDDELVVLGHRLGARSVDGSVASVSFAGTGSARPSDGRVRAALGVMRPHAFVTAFKAQDLIVEWILGPKPGRNPRWTFDEKKAQLATVVAGARPVELQDSTRWKLFREVYGVLVEPRNVVMHRSGLDLGGDGAIGFGLVSPALASLDDGGQRHYLRVVALLGEALTGARMLDRYSSARVDASLAALSALPGVTLTHQREPLRVQLDVEVPSLVEAAQAGWRVDFDFVRRVWAEHEARVPGQVLLGVVNIRPSGSAVAWRFEHDALPIGEVTLVPGAPVFSPFEVHG